MSRGSGGSWGRKEKLLVSFATKPILNLLNFFAFPSLPSFATSQNRVAPNQCLVRRDSKKSSNILCITPRLNICDWRSFVILDNVATQRLLFVASPQGWRNTSNNNVSISNHHAIAVFHSLPCFIN
jgi:hypothetical protein